MGTVAPQVQEVEAVEAHVGSGALIAATIVYAVVGGIGLGQISRLPAASDSPAQLVAWVRENRESVRWMVWCLTVTAPAFALMAAQSSRILPAAYREMFLIGAVTFIATTSVMLWTWGGLALHADQLEAPIARTVLDVAVFYGPVLTGTTTTMIAPVTLLAIRRRAGLPMWLGVLGAIAFTEQAVETVTIFGSTGFTQPGGAMNMELGGTLTYIWILLLCLWAGIRGEFPVDPAH